MSKPIEMPFKELIDALLNEDKPFHPRYLYRLTDLSDIDLAKLKENWLNVSVRRRQAIMEDIEELGETDYLLSFEALARMAIEDPDAKVRMLAVHVLWEYEEPELIPLYLNLLKRDKDPDVRAAAATGLGGFVYLGEIEELPQQDLVDIENTLLQVANSAEHPLVRRRALESLGYSDREEIIPLIEAAYTSGEKDWLITSLFAMGRSADKRWRPMVMEMIDNPYPDIKAEAVRSAGELEIRESAPILLEMLEDEDEDVRIAAVWSLSQIGGDGVRETLEELQANAEDDEEADYLESALDNLSFTEDIEIFSLLDVPEDEVDDELDSLEDDEDNEA